MGKCVKLVNCHRNQYLKARKAATPDIIQSYEGTLLGKLIYITKFVE